MSRWNRALQHPISSIVDEYYSPNFTIGNTQLFSDVVGTNTLVPAIDQELAALEAFRYRLGLDGSPNRDVMLKALRILAEIDARHKNIDQASNLLKGYFDRVMTVCPSVDAGIAMGGSENRGKRSVRGIYCEFVRPSYVRHGLLG
jgi:hypothetical protein